MFRFFERKDILDHFITQKIFNNAVEKNCLLSSDQGFPDDPILRYLLKRKKRTH